MKITELQRTKQIEAKRIAEVFSNGNIELNIGNLIHWFEYAFECGAKYGFKQVDKKQDLINALQLLLKAYQSDGTEDFYNLDPESLAINAITNHTQKII